MPRVLSCFGSNLGFTVAIAYSNSVIGFEFSTINTVRFHSMVLKRILNSYSNLSDESLFPEFISCL